MNISAKQELIAKINCLLAELEMEEADDMITANENENEELEETTEATCSKTASVSAKGVEDGIKDTACGGDATVQEIVKGGNDAKKEVSSDKEVFPTKCKEVSNTVQRVAPIKSKIAKLVKACDLIAEELEENGDLNGALEFVQYADQIESKYLK